MRDGQKASGCRPHRRVSRGERRRLHLRCRRRQHRGPVRRRVLPRRHHRGAGQARVLRRHDGRRLQPQRRRARRGGRDLGRRLPEHRAGAGRGVREPGAGAGADRPTADHARRPGLPSRTPAAATARWTQRRCSPRCRCTAGVWCGPRTSSRRCPRRSRQREPVGPQCCCCPRTFSNPTSVSTVVGFEPDRAHNWAIPGRSRTRCGAPTGRSRSSPVSRSPATTRASNSSSCGRCCAPGSPPCPTPRTSQARQAWDRRRRWVSPV